MKNYFFLITFIVVNLLTACGGGGNKATKDESNTSTNKEPVKETPKSQNRNAEEKADSVAKVKKEKDGDKKEQKITKAPEEETTSE